MKYIALIAIMLCCVAAEWRQYNYKRVELTFEHQMLPSFDTVYAKHYHKAGEKFYVITSDSIEVWCDNVKEIK